MDANYKGLSGRVKVTLATGKFYLGWIVVGPINEQRHVLRRKCRTASEAIDYAVRVGKRLKGFQEQGGQNG
jgi:hypothetical protein